MEAPHFFLHRTPASAMLEMFNGVEDVFASRKFFEDFAER